MHEDARTGRGARPASGRIAPAAVATRHEPTAAPLLRQKILIAYMATSSLTSEIIAWSLYDSTRPGVPPTGTETEPPYRSVFAAMQDGWCILRLELPTFADGGGRGTTNLKYGVVLEKRVPLTPQ